MPEAVYGRRTLATPIRTKMWKVKIRRLAHKSQGNLILSANAPLLQNI
jgi:hypothetical protein